MKPTVSIGIPAYNEEANLGHLLSDLQSQKQTGFKLQEIIVSSDASTDQTVSIAKKYSGSGVKILDNQVRQGQAARQNQIIDLANSDVLVLLNADILIEGRDFVWRLIQPITNNHADLTSSNLLALAPKTFMGQVLFHSLKLRNEVYKKYHLGQNIYTCHGAARAFSKNLYQNFRFQNSVAEDAYSYLYAIFKGYKYRYVADAIAYIRWPESLIDHERQSLRFFQSQKVLSSQFDPQFVSDQYKLPPLEVLKTVVKFYLQYPIHALAYSFIFWFMFCKSFFKRPMDTWQSSVSSKILK
ncbi:MAG: putative glycosyltransferase [Microgenomates group bacterium Gr01-1014_16]|nr:MAG: putative glycosyltransferase [Microgenomates group bacterium Gr01-1014_16]